MKKFILTSAFSLFMLCDIFAQLTGTPISLTTTVTPSTSCTAPCDGTASVKATGGTPPYTYNWSTSPSQTTATATGLCPGTYTVFVLDASPSVPNPAVATVTITCNGTSGNNIVLNTTATPANSCTAPCDGLASVSATGGLAPYTYGWSSIPAQTTQTATGLCPGTYTVTVRDATAPTPNMAVATVTVTCSGITPSQLTVVTSVTPATACTAPCNGTATATPSGGTSPYTYSWGTSPVQTTQTATGLCPGTYTFTVFDSATPNPNQVKSSVTIICSTANGINSYQADQNISVFPNPAHSLLNIEFDSAVQGQVMVSVKGILGTEIYRGIFDATGISAKAIDISSFPDGIYTLELVTDRAVAVKQFIKN